jgi:lysozyme family protein
MSDFNIAYNITKEFEGGYSNDPDDAGGETYKGVARKFNPTWDGWNIIDDIKNKFPSDFKDKLDITILNKKVFSYYKIMYWDKFQGDLIPNQEIANELFDNAVNMGVNRSVSFLQKSLNLLNRNQKNYSDISEDGIFGNNTLKTLHKYLNYDKPNLILKVINILQGIHYINYMTKSPSQEKYARGWLSRVKL